MNLSELMAWQWKTYPENHRNRANLLTHIFAVPLFLAGNIGVIVALTKASVLIGVTALVIMGLAMALQGRGHALERVPPKPFTGPANALARIFAEQWVTFPRYVLSGGWQRALRATNGSPLAP